MNEPKNHHLTRKEQWTLNSAQRRKRIVSEGGRQMLIIIDAHFNQLLNDILAHRRRTDPGFSLHDWIKRMIEADHKALQRGVKRRARDEQDSARSTGPDGR